MKDIKTHQNHTSKPEKKQTPYIGGFKYFYERYQSTYKSDV